MKIDILFYLDEALSDKDLDFMEFYLPDMLVKRLEGVSNIGAVYFSLPESYKGKLRDYDRTFTRHGDDTVDFWKDIFSKTGSSHMMKIFCDTPFLDTGVISEMIDLHLKYLAEFTYSENLPQGFSGEIISGELIKSIPDFDKKTLALSKVIKSNINQFDIELFYKDPDIRDRRISFRSGSVRDKKVMENIYRLKGTIPPYNEIKDMITTNPEVLYVGPSYLELELTGRCDIDCVFCYRKFLGNERGDMDMNLLKKILSDMRHFNLPYTVCFGGSGEPLMHPGVYEALETICSDPLVAQVIMETNGRKADANYKNFILSHEKIKTIVNINAAGADGYIKLHGADSFDQVRNNVAALKEGTGDREALYVQVMKINETEPDLDSYYDYWEKLGVPIILQKQNPYLGLIEDRRYSDLSPLQRVPCWHLQRDLFVLSDGTVTFCKNDVRALSARGNLADTSITDIWERGRKDFLNDYEGKYPSRPNCKSCDEWYTFNF